MLLLLTLDMLFFGDELTNLTSPLDALHQVYIGVMVS